MNIRKAVSHAVNKPGTFALKEQWNKQLKLYEGICDSLVNSDLKLIRVSARLYTFSFLESTLRIEIRAPTDKEKSESIQSFITVKEHLPSPEFVGKEVEVERWSYTVHASRGIWKTSEPDTATLEEDFPIYLCYDLLTYFGARLEAPDELAMLAHMP